MYYVYQISFANNTAYIGCTNNILRRKDQHNANAKSLNSKLGIYLNNNNIYLEKKDLVIIATFVNRQDALKYERDTTIKYDKKGIELLNDNYTTNCSRKNKRNNSYIEYYVIDIVNNTATFTSSLPLYAEQINVSYKSLQDTIKKTYVCHNRYNAFYKDTWLDIQDKDYYLTGKFLVEELAKSKLSHSNKLSQTYLVLTPSGKKEIITNADKYAKEHNLTRGTFHNTLTNGKTTKGYKIIKKLEKEN